MANGKKKGLWVYRASDDDGFPMAEAYSLAFLLMKVEEEFGEFFEVGRLRYRFSNPMTSIRRFDVERIFVEGLE